VGDGRQVAGEQDFVGVPVMLIPVSSPVPFCLHAFPPFPRYEIADTNSTYCANKSCVHGWGGRVHWQPLAALFASGLLCAVDPPRCPPPPQPVRVRSLPSLPSQTSVTFSRSACSAPPPTTPSTLTTPSRWAPLLPPPPTLPPLAPTVLHRHHIAQHHFVLLVCSYVRVLVCVCVRARRWTTRAAVGAPLATAPSPSATLSRCLAASCGYVDAPFWCCCHRLRASRRVLLIPALLLLLRVCMRCMYENDFHHLLTHGRR
jgi:hypothetical protein